MFGGVPAWLKATGSARAVRCSGNNATRSPGIDRTGEINLRSLSVRSTEGMGKNDYRQSYMRQPQVARGIGLISQHSAHAGKRLAASKTEVITDG